MATRPRSGDAARGGHPSLRPHRAAGNVSHAWNPDYHAVIREFERRTGGGAMLNTSFNLHGDPVVCTAGDAVRHVRALRPPPPRHRPLAHLEEVVVAWSLSEKRS